MAYFTIGHSNRSIAAFIDLLQRSEIGIVADVRRFPGSRACPQFNAEALEAALAGYQIGYAHLAELGGRRGRTPELPDSPNGFWENRSFRNYADYALTAPFRSGLARLEALGETRTVAMMCAEAVWWRCHRRIIADYLLAHGHAVFHILGPEAVTPATRTPAARPAAEGGLIYPAAGDPADDRAVS